MNQTSFLDGGDLLVPQARARATDPDTSHAAAATVNVARSHRLVAEALRQLGEANSEQVVAHLAGQSTPGRVRGALSELTKRGVLRIVCERENERGNPCGVYALNNEIHGG